MTPTILALLLAAGLPVPPQASQLPPWYHWLFEAFRPAGGGSGTILTVTGVSPLALVNALAGPLHSLTQYGKCEQRNLPAGYTQLDYIEGNGTAYIDTGVLLSNTDVFEITFQSLNALASPVMGAISGGTSYTSTNNLSVTYTINVGLSAYSVYCDGAAGHADYSWNGGNRADGLKHTIKYNGLNIAPMLDGVAMTQVTSHTLVESTPTVTTWLFGRNSTSTGTLAQSGVRIFDFNIQSKGHFIPARRNSDNVLGMYDLVSGQFLTNAGTGSFTAGPDAVPTPSAPVDILCNNGVLRYSANMANVNEQTARVGYYINAQGAVLADQYNWFYQAYIPVKPNTAYTLSMSSAVYYVTISEYSTAEDSGFIIRKAGNTGNNTSLTITTGATTNYIRFGANLNRVTVSMGMVLAIDWMFNLGGTAMDYQPYVKGGIYTDGTPEVLTIRGENLLDPSESNIAIGEIYSQGGEQISSQNNWRTGFIPIEGGKTYAFWGRKKSDNTISAYNRINWFDADGNNISPRPSYTVDTVTVGTAPSNAAFAGLSCAPNNSSAAITRATFDLLDWMFAEAAQEIPYEPYVTPQTVTGIPILLGVGDYKDAAELIQGIKTGKVGIKVFDGTETFTVSSSGAMITAISDVAVGAQNTPMNTHFALETSPTSIAVGTQRFGASGTVIYSANYYMKHTTITTVADFKAWLASEYANGTPVIVIYPRTNEQTEQTTPHSLHTTNGTTIVTADTNVDPVELRAEYKGVVT